MQAVEGAMEKIVQSLDLMHHTGQRKIAKVLELAGRIITNATSKLPSTYGLVGLDLVTESQGAKAARNVRHVLGMKAIRMKSHQGTFVGREMLMALFRRLC
jgi:hypothetical protein